MNQPRVYKNSAASLLLIVLFFIAFLIPIFFGLGSDSVTIILPIVGFVLFIFVVIFLAHSSKVILSEDEITVQNLLGSKTLRWTEISRVSGRGSGIKLHNFDEDVTVAPNPSLPGYEEIIAFIGTKRPDLFSPQEYSEMRRGWLSLIPLAVVLLVFFGFMLGLVWQFLSSPDQAPVTYMPGFVLVFITVIIVGMALSMPHTLTLEGNSLTIKYLFNEKNLQADEIASVQYAYTRTRNGKVYYIALHLTNRKMIRVSGLGISLPVAYLVLRNWHKQNTATH